MTPLTPFQTVGPYWSIGLREGIDVAPQGTRIVIRGRLLDGQGTGIPDGVLEWWHPDLPEVQRSPTGADGGFVVDTIKPGAIDGPAGRTQAPHLAIRVLGRGILTQYHTRLYFADDPGNAGDPILGLVPEDRRPTLLAQRASADEYRFDVILQGPQETVFFDL
ncbi:MAG TPA: hypothetical protein VF491_15580 [Vicinamibacterales bacterium]|jgi:protocatechuate 3,4-dioxygenase alpha subunit